MVKKHPAVGQQLLAKISRLHLVAQMIGLQNTPPEWNGNAPPETDAEVVALGSNLLAVALSLDAEIVAGHSRSAAFAALEKGMQLDKRIIKLLVNLPCETSEETIQVLTLSELRSQMVLDQDVMSRT
ncbi:MAG: hypothetical protein OEZ06_24795 [Myxococcales bacterium]|nr:hypothetical protein [Myxococcales bacterium]